MRECAENCSIQMGHATAGCFTTSLASAALRCSILAPVWGIHDRKIEERLPLGLLTRLSSITRSASRPSTSTVRIKNSSAHARFSNAQRRPVRCDRPKGMPPIGLISSSVTGSGVARSASINERNVSGVRRQNIRHNSRRRLAECGPRQGVDVRRRTCGAASADVRWSVA